MKKVLFAQVLILSFLVSKSYTQDILTDIHNIKPAEIKIQGFGLDRDQEVKIEGVGFQGPKRRGPLLTRAWILDSRTREVVWDIEDADTERQGRRLVKFEDRLELPEGDYEVYYSSFLFVSSSGHEGFWGRVYREIFDDEDLEDDYDHFKDAMRSFHVTVTGIGKRYREEDIPNLHKAFTRNAFVTVTKVHDDAQERRCFELQRPTDIRIYSVGEARKDGTFDYGWIINSATRERVWKMTLRNSDHAGGSRKNRIVNEVVTLPAGRYLAIFVTDGSHSYDGWNSPPPYDPQFWGITLSVVEPSERRQVKLVEDRDREEGDVIVELTRLRNDEFRSKGFRLKNPVKVRIYAIGEGRRGKMFDYGWIVNDQTHKKVWKMVYGNTEHAGGDEKNRLYDGVVKLDKGDYIVYYMTDDSHSYWDWNSAPPYDKDGWGIKLMGASESFNSSDVTDYEPKRNGAILARLVRIRDHERERQRFTIERQSEIRIYAIGEGARGTMYDYAWIEDDDGRVVWEMTYRKTRHAGGANKNRLFDEIVFLQPGEYVLYYESDDSHSFDDWNDSPPDDPIHWGVTLYRVNDK
ncbi:MAG: hypothetical protein ACE5IR_08740 [bacterium]